MLYVASATPKQLSLPSRSTVGLDHVVDIILVCCTGVVLLRTVFLFPAPIMWICSAICWFAAVLMIGTDAVSPTKLDCCVIGLCAFELISIPVSVYPANSWVYVQQLAMAVAIYLAVSRLRTHGALVSLSVIVCAIAAIAAMADVKQFIARYDEWKQLRFGSIADVKKLLTSVGSSPGGEHYTMYLWLLAWALVASLSQGRMRRIANVGGLIASAACLISMFVSLSRGLYVAILFGTCCISVVVLRGVRERSHKWTGGIAAASVMAGLLIFCGIRRDVSHDVLAFVTSAGVSPSRSMEGRESIWMSSLRMGAMRPILGFGGRTFPLYGASGTTHSHGDYIYRAFSLPVQLFLERGCLGSTMYLLFFVVVFGAAKAKLKGNNEEEIWIITIAMIALASLLIRDLSYSTLFQDWRITIGAFSLIGLIGRDSARLSTSVRGRGPRARSQKVVAATISVLLLGMGIVLTQRGIKREKIDWLVRAAVRADARADEEEAVSCSRRALDITPTPFLEAEAGLFLAKSARIELNPDEPEANSRLSSDQFRLIREASNEYEDAIRGFPSVASWHHNLGWLLWFKNDRNSALESVRRAVILEPNTAVYRQSLILMLLATKQSDAAKQELVQALVRSPEVMDSSWWQLIGSKYEAAAQASVQEALLSADPEQKGDPIASAREARVYLEVGDWNSAERSLNRALMELPSLSGGWRNYALICARRGKWNDAVEDLERALYLNPADYAAYYALSRASIQLHDGTDNRHLSNELRAKAHSIHRAVRSPESLRVYQKFQVDAAVRDDFVIKGLLRFCMPDMQLEADKVVPWLQFEGVY